jgi:hypothetical protein
MHCRAAWGDGALPSGPVVARHLRDFLDLPSANTPLATLTEIQRRFQIRRSSSIVVKSGQGRAKIGCDTSELPLKEKELLINAGPAGARRVQFVRAHEVAHFFFAALTAHLYRSPDPARFRRSQQGERFCWEFALELFCPKAERQRWRAPYLDALLSIRDHELTAALHAAGGPRLSYWHVRALAARYGISIRATIRALDRTPVLSELACGLAVLRYAPNQWTGREHSHRVWQTARPSWGHLIFNQRAAKQGFDHAAACYDDGKSQVSELRQEELTLQRRSCPGARWRQQRFIAMVSYTPIDVKEEGRYLLAIWDWPDPAHAGCGSG